MNNKKKFYFMLLFFNFIMLFSIVFNKSIPNHKILFEYKNNNNFIVSENYSKDYEYTNDNVEYTMQLKFNYIDCNFNSKTECKKYFTTNNKKIVNDLNLNKYLYYCSEYTPYVFLKFNKDENFFDIYNIASIVSQSDYVDNIRISESDVYNFKLDDLDNESKPSFDIVDSSDGYGNYENYPSGTSCKGQNIKIGLLDTGIFDTNNENFKDIHVETVYDKYTSDSETNHPTKVASVLGGKYGYASKSSIYYVDVNSDCSYTGIEKLIDKGCSIINMSIALSSCENNGEYDTGLEGYLDYIYTTTKVIMVAASGNTLNKEGSGGYVTFPSLCANVISVGSVDNKYTPSVFSSYKVKNNVDSNPFVVAVGTERYIEGFGNCSGTSFAAPAVTGAIAMYFSKYGVKELPLVMSMIAATSNSNCINTTSQTINLANSSIICTNNKKSNGLYERTGVGIIDITKIIGYTNSSLSNQTVFQNNNLVSLKQIYLNADENLKAAISWQRNATLTINKVLWIEKSRTYSSNDLADVDLYLYDENGIIAKSISSQSNIELLTFKASHSGYYTIKAKSIKNYSDLVNINYSYYIYL